MELNKGTIYLPKERKGGPVKYLCICAEPIDAEMMAIDGIQRGYRAQKYTFACVVSSDGATCPRKGKYLNYTDGQMKAVRISEQKKASEIGRYNSVYFLKYSKSEVLDPENEDIINEYVKIIKELKPRLIYTHSLLDSNPINVSVAVKVINALRKMKKGEQPKQLYGCELSRELDWVDKEKITIFDVSKNIRLQKQLLSVYHSQIDGGKDYLKAALGRRYEIATFFDANKIDEFKLASRVINMTTLLRRKDLPIKKYAMSFVEYLYGEINDSMDRSL